MNKLSMVGAFGIASVLAGCAGGQDVVYIPVEGNSSGSNPYVSTNYDTAVESQLYAKIENLFWRVCVANNR